jgi:hypothetical protein
VPSPPLVDAKPDAVSDALFAVVAGVEVHAPIPRDGSEYAAKLPGRSTAPTSPMPVVYTPGSVKREKDGAPAAPGRLGWGVYVPMSRFIEGVAPLKVGVTAWRSDVVLTRRMRFSFCLARAALFVSSLFTSFSFVI